jgi:hypothetical protein
MDPTASLKAARILLDDDDDEEDLLNELLFLQRPPGAGEKCCFRGSRPTRAPNKRCDFHARHRRLLEQYFGPSPVYSEQNFRKYSPH